MSQVWVVARREYLEQVRTKGFVIATLAVPLIMLGLMALGIFLGVRSQQSEREMALVDYTGVLGASVAAELGAAGWEVEVVEPSGDGVAELEQRLEDDEIEAYMILDDATASEGAFVYRSKDGPRRVFRAISERVVAEASLAARLSYTEGWKSLQELLDGGTLVFRPVGQEEVVDDAWRSTRTRIVGLGGAILLFMSTMLYGTAVLMSVVSEQANRVVEVMFVSVRPWRLLLGKMVGVGGMGITQVGIWSASAVPLGLLGLPLAAAHFPVANAQQMRLFLPGAGEFVLFLAFFVLGYFLYAGLYAAVGAMCDKEENAQQLQLPVIMFTAIAFGLQTASMNGPAGSADWLNWLALFPFFTPILMFPRVVAGIVPYWMPILSLCLMTLATFGMAWIAGRIYQTGMFMRGKRPTLMDILRWIRARPGCVS